MLGRLTTARRYVKYLVIASPLTEWSYYATAWLEYRRLGNQIAASAFTGATPELISNTNWPGSAVKER
jgi:hypothetical protein